MKKYLGFEDTEIIPSVKVSSKDLKDFATKKWINGLRKNGVKLVPCVPVEELKKAKDKLDKKSIKKPVQSMKDAILRTGKRMGRTELLEELGLNKPESDSTESLVKNRRLD